MKDTAFFVFCELLTVLIVASYGVFRTHFAKDPTRVVQIQMLKEQLKQEQLKTDLALEDLEEFKAFVAIHLPEAIKAKGRKESGYGIRTLASLTTRGNTENLKAGLGQTQFQKAKQSFLKEDYANAKDLFQQFIRRHPFSPDIIEGNFLLMESLSHLGETEASLQIVEKMVEQFPESELTGFAMVKLGAYLEEQGRKLEASQIYKTILKSYPFHDVTTAAAKSLRSLEI